MTDAPAELRRSSRDPEALRARLQDWLRTRHPDARITALAGTSATGMSSDTLLFDAEWTADGSECREALVARLAPDPTDVPVFPAYDLTRQFDAVRVVAANSAVPVPVTYWNEPDPAPLGTPFFVMGQVAGQVPPDVMPYNFGDSWLFHATPGEQRKLQDATVDVLAELHTVAPPGFLEFAEPGDTGPGAARRTHPGLVRLRRRRRRGITVGRG